MDRAEDEFFKLLEQELERVNKFTQQLVNELRAALKVMYARADKATDDEKDALLAEAKRLGEEYLALEKYVNLNYMGFHKILKKHDKMMPHAPCRQFYVAHLHQQPWVQGTYSDLLVQLSNVYSMLRGDTAGQKNEDAAQGFVRSTTKYWVRNEDVSTVKHHVLQHLPVFQFEKNNFAGDAQLINSVYLDNQSLELYHGRLDKRPGAIALRLRWYGSGEVSTVFVERKTHRESWKGEESVKERFTLKEEKVIPFLKGEYTLDRAVADLRAAGKSENEIEKFSELFTEVYAQVDSKQLRPLVRTQYMRTAFQIPFDATVRVSLDTNLAMIKEAKDGLPAIDKRWYRDPSVQLQRTEVTRFPHGVLEVKLSLPEGEAQPAWLQELLDSGYLTEVHKFSKFIHGTCTLFPDMVQAVPYWVDDESVRASMLMSAPNKVLTNLPDVPEEVVVEEPVTASRKPRKRNPGLDELTHPLLGEEASLQLMPSKDEIRGLRRPAASPSPFTFSIPKHGWLARLLGFPDPDSVGTVRSATAMRIEPKTLFANERTFLSWLSMAVTIGSIAAAMLGFAGTDTGSSRAPTSVHLVEIISLILLPVAIAMCAYALFTFMWRAKLIIRKQVGQFDDRVGPLGLCATVVVALTAIFIFSLVDFIELLRHRT